MTTIEQYRAGLISLDELVYELYAIDQDKDWIKDCLGHILNSTNYTHAMEILTVL
jgi:hypothetical protein